jgi:hypothetical protein
VAAFHAASDERITISIPAGPLHLAFEIYEDLREAQMDTYGPDTKEVIAISKRIVDRNQPNKQRPDEDDVITLSAAEWAFIRERAKRLQSIYADGYHERQRDAAAAAIIEVISRHLQ